MKFYLLLLSICISIPTVYAQQPADYRTDKNPVYWGNRLPDAAYWQQDVAYTINARIDEEKHIIEGSETLEYYNNSPDTLEYVYFHMWQNAFVKGSYLHMLESANGIKPRLGKYEAQGLGIVVENLKVDGAEAKTELDNTILKVYLPKPLLPGDNATFNMDFTTYWDKGATRRRMKMYNAWGYTHYNGVQWFPKISVYDRKFGWDTHQHLNKEFYGDFGTYNVKLDFPSNYVVEATGAIQNREEVLPKELREKLDVSNFKDKPWGEKPSIITPYTKGERKVWHFIAQNVHDFAFTADPTYRIDTEYWNGIECVGLVQEPHASGWQTSADYVAKIIQTFSEDFGMYQYPKMVAADAADGMEYPMLTLDGGRDPGYRGLLVHEIGHNWFYGMVGNNETYRASLDEGFTQFLTAWGLTKLEGELANEEPEKTFKKWAYHPISYRDIRVYTRYINGALNKTEVPLNTHSNDFNNAIHHEGGYAQVYYKTATMLYNLQYVLGDTLFHDAMRNYFNQWRFAHPYFDDFRTSIIQYTKVDLNWFFDQWLETTKRIDYSVCNIQKLDDNDNYSIKLMRKGEMQMPIDFTVTAKDGQQYSYYIPNTWFEKETDATTLERWYGWGNWNNTYNAVVNIPSGIKEVEIDTSDRLADIYELDNYKTRCLPFSPKAIEVKPDVGAPIQPYRDQMHVRIRPDIWWNAVDGIKLGAHFRGNYMRTMHRLDAAVWLNTHILQQAQFEPAINEGWYDRYDPVNYNIEYQSPLTRNMPHLEIRLHSKLLDGLWYHRGGLSWEVDGKNNIQLYAQTMWRNSIYDLDYLLYPNEWSSTSVTPNSTINAEWNRSLKYLGGRTWFNLHLSAPLLTNQFNYSFAELTAVNYNTLGKLDVKTRLYGRYGRGNNLPYESILWSAGANPETMMNNKYTRSVGFVPTDWLGFSPFTTNNFQQGGGLNLRGYAGNLVAEVRNGQILLGYKGRSGASLNIEADFDRYFPLKPKFTRKWLHIDLYAFADAGLIELSSISTFNFNRYWEASPTNMWSGILADAGLGTALTIKNWFGISEAKPLTIRFDMPFYMNQPPGTDDNLQFRYVIGINRAF